MNDSHAVGPSTPGILRKVSGFTTACVLVSSVIGSGIFTTTGFMARDLGDPWLILSLWLLGALFALTGAMSYSELGAAMPEAGGEYVYLRQAYGPFFGFLSGWASFTVGFGAAVAAAAMSFAAYFLQIFPIGHETDTIGKTLALLLVWTFTFVHTAGVEAGGWLQRTLTVSKMGAVFLLISGAFLFGEGHWEHLAVQTAEPQPHIGTIVVSFIFVIYAYSGWNVAGYLAGEITEPERTIPRTMIAGTLFVGLVYLVLNLVYFYAMPVTALAQAPLLPVAEKAAAALFGPTAAHFVAALLCLSIAGAVSAMVWAGPRVYYAMARDRLLPEVFAETRAKGGAPWKSIILQSVWTSILIISGTFEQLVVYSGVVITIFTALAVATVPVLRWSNPNLPRPYRIPLYPLPPLLFLSASIMILAYTLIGRPLESLFAVATVLTGAPVYLIWRRFQRGLRR